VTGGKPIAFIALIGVSPINPLVAFYGSHGRKRVEPLFYLCEILLPNGRK
jgi:hypothetical protein